MNRKLCNSTQPEVVSTLLAGLRCLIWAGTSSHNLASSLWALYSLNTPCTNYNCTTCYHIAQRIWKTQSLCIGITIASSEVLSYFSSSFCTYGCIKQTFQISSAFLGIGIQIRLWLQTLPTCVTFYNSTRAYCSLKWPGSIFFHDSLKNLKHSFHTLWT